MTNDFLECLTHMAGFYETKVDDPYNAAIIFCTVITTKELCKIPFTGLLNTIDIDQIDLSIFA